jgi:ABC-type phosphate/phosphonate transport system substrate-binding protein
MTSRAIAALPMYDFPALVEATDAWWAGIARQLRDRGVRDVPPRLSRDLGHVESWRHPGLLLGQACEYPLATAHGAFVRPIATPRYAAPGCEGACYRSAIVVRREDSAANVGHLAGRRCVANEPDSNSGMNLLRARIASFARDGRFFSSVAYSGSHLASAESVAAGTADVAAIDCVSYAQFVRLYPELTARLRILDWTESSPALPYVTARGVDEATRGALAAALATVAADPELADVRDALRIEGFAFEPDPDYRRVRALARAASEAGYPALR